MHVFRVEIGGSIANQVFLSLTHLSGSTFGGFGCDICVCVHAYICMCVCVCVFVYVVREMVICVLFSGLCEDV